jgi:hypothetical protein
MLAGCLTVAPARLAKFGMKNVTFQYFFMAPLCAVASPRDVAVLNVGLHHHNSYAQQLQELRDFRQQHRTRLPLLLWKVGVGDLAGQPALQPGWSQFDSYPAHLLVRLVAWELSAHLVIRLFLCVPAPLPVQDTPPQHFDTPYTTGKP